jgi:hypothetical protein
MTKTIAGTEVAVNEEGYLTDMRPNGTKPSPPPSRRKKASAHSPRVT